MEQQQSSSGSSPSSMSLATQPETQESTATPTVLVDASLSLNAHPNMTMTQPLPTTQPFTFTQPLHAQCTTATKNSALSMTQMTTDTGMMGMEQSSQQLLMTQPNMQFDYLLTQQQQHSMEMEHDTNTAVQQCQCSGKEREEGGNSKQQPEVSNSVGGGTNIDISANQVPQQSSLDEGNDIVNNSQPDHHDSGMKNVNIDTINYDDDYDHGMAHNELFDSEEDDNDENQHDGNTNKLQTQGNNEQLCSSSSFIEEVGNAKETNANNKNEHPTNHDNSLESAASSSDNASTIKLSALGTIQKRGVAADIQAARIQIQREKQQQQQQKEAAAPPTTKRIIANPYAKRNNNKKQQHLQQQQPTTKMVSMKRSIHQISGSKQQQSFISSSASSALLSSNDVHVHVSNSKTTGNTQTPPPLNGSNHDTVVPVRKQAFNPYAKSSVVATTTTITAKQTTPKSATGGGVRNPYAKTPSVPPPAATTLSIATKSLTNKTSATTTTNYMAQLQAMQLQLQKQQQQRSNNASMENARDASANTKSPQGTTTQQQQQGNIQQQLQPPQPLQQFRHKGISISLPISERLPSRNVSYQPAEILSVGELYRYLYCLEDEEDNDAVVDDQQQLGGAQSASVDGVDATTTGTTNMSSAATGESNSTPRSQTSKELISVRITGTLLCVSTNCPPPKNNHYQAAAAAAVGSGVYSSGTFLLLGDPLDNTRFIKRQRQPVPTLSEKQSGDESNAPPSSVNPTASKVGVGLTSILRNKKAPMVSLSAPNKPAAATTMTMTDHQIEGVSTDNPPASLAAETPAAKKPNANNEGIGSGKMISTVNSKPINRGSILNNTNNKKKKLVYNGGSSAGGKRLSFGGGERKRLSFGGGGEKKRLSFGGRGTSGGAGGGLLGRKFVTPKRHNVNSGLSFGSSSANRNSLLPIKSNTGLGGTVSNSGGKNPKPEHVIQRHPSPIVPVWVGSYYNGDGLDGSVVGDLVMVMGELVIEHCGACQQHDNSNSDDDDLAAEGNNEHSENNNKTDHDDENINDVSLANDSEVMKNNSNDEEDGSQQARKKPPSCEVSTHVRCVNDAASSIAACAMRVMNGPPPTPTTTQTRPETQNPLINNKKRKSFCNHCTRFLRARFVKNANGTDMTLQKEALKARRSYLDKRRRQMESLMPARSSNVIKDFQGLYSVGCGPLI